jgi:hypothetical protein
MKPRMAYLNQTFGLLNHKSYQEVASCIPLDSLFADKAQNQIQKGAHRGIA